MAKKVTAEDYAACYRAWEASGRVNEGWDEWLESAIPELDGKSPHDAIANGDRDKVVTLIESY